MSAEFTAVGPVPTTLTSETTTIASEISSVLSSMSSESLPTAITASTTIPQTASGPLELSTVETTPTSTATSSDPTSTGQPANTVTEPASPSASETQSPGSTQLSTGSIVGIAIGSIVAVILLVLCLLFVLGFRLQREKWRRRGTLSEAPEPRDNSKHQAAASSPSGQHGKAELEDAEYTRRLERLHDGVKPELEGSRPWKSVWRVFSIRSGRKQESQVAAAELGADDVAPGPHELPGDGGFQQSNDAPRERVAEGDMHLGI